VTTTSTDCSESCWSASAAIPGGDDVESGALEHSADEPAHADRVVDEQDTALGLGGGRGDRLTLAAKLGGTRPGRCGAQVEQLQQSSSRTT